MTPILDLLRDLGCDLYLIPRDEFELAVLAMRFIAVLSIVILCLKFLLLITRHMIGGRW